jgi:hypothetical protein
MRFLVNTLLGDPIPHLIHAFRQNSLWIRSGCAAVFVFPVKAALAIRGSWRGTIAARNLWTPVQSCFSKLLARQYTQPKSLPAVVCAPSRTLLFPDAKQRQG